MHNFRPQLWPQRYYKYGWALALCSPLLGNRCAQAQSITAAADGVGTAVTQTGSHFDISAGSTSADNVNLFHSFDSFSLSAEETANFQVNDSVQNVLARVSGGAPSVINGQIQMSGTSINTPDLYLMNPAGVLIGEEAHLNLPGNLTVTTADGIGVGHEQSWFQSTGEHVYSALEGAPTGEFIFAHEQPASIVNEADLSLESNASLTLLGGSVVNTGEISIPGGTVTLAAVSGESVVRLSQSGHLLSLELETAPAEQLATLDTPQATGIRALDLPELLTHQTQEHASSLTVNLDGTVSLGAGIEQSFQEQSFQGQSFQGHAIASGTLNTSTQTGTYSTNRTSGGSINVLGEQVSLIEATLTANGEIGGGSIRIGGDTRGQETLLAAQQTSVDANSYLSANATESGAGGQVVVWAEDTTQYLGSITARGGAIDGQGGFVEVSGKRQLQFNGTVDTRSPNGEIGTLLLDPEDVWIFTGNAGANDNFLLDDNQILADDTGALLTISEQTLESLSGNANIIVEATNDIIFRDILDDRLSLSEGIGSVTFRADADGDNQGDVSFQDSQDMLIAPGRDITFSGAGLQLGSLNTVGSTQGGTITLTASGLLSAVDLDTRSAIGTSGDITVEAGDTITLGALQADSVIQAGNITLSSQSNRITTGDISNFLPDGSQGTLTVISSNNGTSNSTLSLISEVIENPIERIIAGPPPANVSPSVSSLFSSFATADADSDSAATLIQRSSLSQSQANAAIAALESAQTESFSDYFQRDLQAADVDLGSIQSLLSTVEEQSGNRSAVVYVKAPTASESATGAASDHEIWAFGEDTLSEDNPTENDLELILLTADNSPVQFVLPEVERTDLLGTVEQFRADLATSVRRQGDYHLDTAESLYEWLIAPVEADLSAAGIDTVVFALDEGLRTLPLAALYDGEQFLVEKYSLGVVPSLGMLNTHTGAIAPESTDILAMGASQFETLTPLPGVPAELAVIQDLYAGESFLNEQFTRENLIDQRQLTPYPVVHLATHANFNSGAIDNSYIQLWDEKLLLSELDQLGWQSPAVDLLVLSACRTAVGSPEAEMGFAGLAIASGVRSSLASLWSVDDVGTLSLMSEFYEHLSSAPTKAEALQLAQLALLSGSLDNELSTTVENNNSRDYSHPYYWSGFTMIGNPW
ncbi:MAG: CHAT domain-containing protein [Cyanobacteria bacterium J06643_4]